MASLPGALSPVKLAICRGWLIVHGLQQGLVISGGLPARAWGVSITAAVYNMALQSLEVCLFKLMT